MRKNFDSKELEQMKASLRDKEMQQLVLMSQLGLSLYQEKSIRKKYGSRLDGLFSQIDDNVRTIEGLAEEIEKASNADSRTSPSKGDTVRCPKCGTSLEKTHAFCFSCGNDMSKRHIASGQGPSSGDGLIDRIFANTSLRSVAGQQVQESSKTPASESRMAVKVDGVDSEVVSEGAQIVAKAKRERKTPSERRRGAAGTPSQKTEAPAEPDDSAESTSPSTGKLRVNPEKVKSDKGHAKRKSSKGGKAESRNGSDEAGKGDEKKGTGSDVRKQAPQSQAAPEVKEPPVAEPVDDVEDEFDPWQEYDADEFAGFIQEPYQNETDQAFIDGNGFADDADTTGAEETIDNVFDKMSERKKKQKGSWSESLATLETEIDPFASLEKKRKRSFRKDLYDMTESIPPDTQSPSRPESGD